MIRVQSKSIAASSHSRQIRVGYSPRQTAESRKLVVANAMSVKDVKVTVYSSQQYVRDFMTKPMADAFPSTVFVEPALDAVTASLAKGSDAVVLFVNDPAPADVIHALADNGVKMIAMRCAGFDRVDLEACAARGIKVARVPTYSPQSVAEHAVALMFALNRHLHNSYLRVMQGNYALSGLVGNQMFEKTVGVVGTGAIGLEAVRILRGIGCKVLAYDIRPNPKVLELGATYMQIEEMLPLCDIITLHCPLLPSTYHLIDKKKIDLMKPGTMLINTSRGGLIDSDALFDGLESDHIGALGLDVYENESKLFFRDFTVFDSNVRMKNWDRRLKTLLTYPNVIVTPHSAFLTREALLNIAQTTIENISNWAQDKDLGINEVKPQPAK